jgi:hypothetical protein
MITTLNPSLGAQWHTQGPARPATRSDAGGWANNLALRPTPQVPLRPAATALVVCPAGVIRDRLVRGLTREGWRVVSADDADDAFRCVTGRRTAPASPSNRSMSNRAHGGTAVAGSAYGGNGTPGRRAPSDLASMRRFDLIVSAVPLPWLDSEVLGVVPPLLSIDVGSGAPLRGALSVAWPFTEAQVATAASRAIRDEN